MVRGGGGGKGSMMRRGGDARGEGEAVQLICDEKPKRVPPLTAATNGTALTSPKTCLRRGGNGRRKIWVDCSTLLFFVCVGCLPVGAIHSSCVVLGCCRSVSVVDGSK